MSIMEGFERILGRDTFFNLNFLFQVFLVFLKFEVHELERKSGFHHLLH